MKNENKPKLGRCLRQEHVLLFGCVGRGYLVQSGPGGGSQVFSQDPQGEM